MNIDDIIILLDPGHGGTVNGKYVTAPDKMYFHEKENLTIYEGVWNRQVLAKLKYLLKKERVRFEDVTLQSQEDVPLQERVKFANEKAKRFNNRAIYVSIHANAGKGEGFEVFTSKGETLSDKVAEIYLEEMSKEFPKRKARKDLTDGDGDKEANFYVLTRTTCPAILTESFFMDNLSDCSYMVTNEAQERVARVHCNTIVRAIKELYLNEKPKEETPKRKTQTRRKKGGKA